MLYLIVFVGAGLGGALRHGVNVWAVRAFGYEFPFGTLIVNILGSFALGLLVGFFAYRAGLVPQHARLFLTTGVLGGFTTFSAFSLEAAVLLERHSYSIATGYIVSSVFGGLVALFLGLAMFSGGKPVPLDICFPPIVDFR